MNDINIVDGTIIDGKKEYAASIGIKDGKIVQICGQDEIDDAAHTLNAGDMLIMPGMIDSHVHIRGGSLSHREDFTSGTCAAAAGGVTTIVEMPVASPPASTAAVFLERVKEADSMACVDFCMLGGAGNDNLDEIKSISECGAVGFKTFLMPAPHGREKEFYGLCSVEKRQLKTVMSAVAKTGLVLAVHAENYEIVNNELQKVMKSGKKDLNAFALARPAEAEIRAIQDVIETSIETGCKVLICHTSTPAGVKSIDTAKQNGANIFAETCPQYLLINSEYANKYGAFARVKPPIRSENMRAMLWELMLQDKIDILGSDHAPYLVEEKMRGRDDVFNSVDGIPGLELSLPLMLSKVSDGGLTYSQIVKVFSENAARLFGIYPRKGCIEKGSDADFVIVKKRNDYRKIDTDKMFSKAKQCARVFEEYEINHDIIFTIVRGKVVFERGKVCTRAGYGEFVRPIKQ